MTTSQSIPSAIGDFPADAAPPLALPGASPMHSGVTVTGFFNLQLMGAIFPMSAGLLLYGWRALLVILGVVGTAAVMLSIWRRIGARGDQLRHSHGLWLALLLALTLPAHLATLNNSEQAGYIVWPLIPAAAIVLVSLMWLLGGVGSGRIHSVVVTYLLLVVFFQELLVPYRVLQKSHLFVGDVLDAGRSASSVSVTQSWIHTPHIAGQNAVWKEPVSQRLRPYTSGTEQPDRTWLSLNGLLRDRMPPLEDLIVGGQPGPIGAGSAIAVIIGGLFLLYRRLIDFRIPMLIFLGAFVAFLILPIPIEINERVAKFHWAALRYREVGWATAITLANYEIMAGPLLFMAFFLATSPAVRPMSRRARVLYALLIGILSAFFQYYASISFGPYLAMLIISLLTPTLDKLVRPRTLV